MFTNLKSLVHQYYYNIATIADMQKALMRQDNFADVLADDSKRKEATEKWKGLQKTLDWKDYHF